MLLSYCAFVSFNFEFEEALKHCDTEQRKKSKYVSYLKRFLLQTIIASSVAIMKNGTINTDGNSGIIITSFVEWV